MPVKSVVSRATETSTALHGQTLPVWWWKWERYRQWQWQREWLQRLDLSRPGNGFRRRFGFRWRLYRQCLYGG